jgi:FdrA protein
MTVTRAGRTVRPMPLACLVRPGAYFDSVVLMQIASELRSRPGVRNASLGMGTAANKEVLEAAGLLAPDAATAGPNDLIVALDTDEGGADEALAAAEAALEARTAAPAPGGTAEARRPRTLAEAPAGLAIISTPGRYAGAEALKALRLGMNVFCFSDNVALEQEIELKREAHSRGLIVMGPDCGTGMVAGVPLGFVNEVRAGDVGLIGASGTGLQQVSTLVDRWGAGVSHMIGVGSHDLAAAVGAISMLDALDALAADPATKVIGLISKPPDPEVAERVLARAAASGKPVVAAFLGADPEGAPAGVTMAATLEDAARALVRASTGSEPSALGRDAAPPAGARGDRRLLRGLYAGGTFAYEAKLLLEPRIGEIGDDADPPAGDRPARLPDGHLILDLGDDRFTVGRPHPMIDPAVRLDMLRAAGDDPRTAVILLDVVLGHLAADDPAGDLAPVIAEIAARPDAPAVVCCVVGTDADPQGRERQERALRDAGALLAPSSSAAAALAEAMIPTEVPA